MLSRRHLLASGTATLGLAACATPSAPAATSTGPSERLAEFFEAQYDQGLVKYPERATGQGDKRGYDKWNDDTDVFAARAVIEVGMANQTLKNLTRSLGALNASDTLSVRLFDKNTKRTESGAKFRGHSYLFDQMNGAHAGIPTFLANQHKVASVEDAQAYISRLEGVTTKLGTLVERSQSAFGRGIMPPKFIFDYVINDSQNLLKGAPFTEGGSDSPMWADAQAKINGLTADEAIKTRLKGEARAALLAHVKPAYENLVAVMISQQRGARATDGVWALPDGEAYYAERLANQTTTSLSAEEIHKMGLDNVARLHGEWALLCALSASRAPATLSLKCWKLIPNSSSPIRLRVKRAIFAKLRPSLMPCGRGYLARST
jgi:uncharacterized protein (DUF885 family)